MTFLEKVQIEHPEDVGPQYPKGVYGCPWDYGLESSYQSPCASMDCIDCWNREMPGTEPTTKNEPASENGANEADGMTAEREGHILEAAIKAFGNAAQVDMMIKEMSELTKALLKYRRWHEGTGARSDERLSDILDEMANVQIMLNQMALIFGDPVEHEIAKLERLEKRLSEYAGVDD